MSKKAFEALVLCYGTLRKDCGNYNHLLHPKLGNGVEYIGEVDTAPEYTMVHMGWSFPGVICKGNTSIKGDLFKITDEIVLARLDQLEGYHGKGQRNFYDRVEVPTEHGNAFMYVLDESYLANRPIASGDWKKETNK